MNPQEQSKSTVHLPISHNFALFLIGLIILGSLAYLSYTFLHLREPTKKDVVLDLTTSTTTEDLLVDWKTYRNEEYGFEFKYPTGYKISFSDEIQSPTNQIWHLGFSNKKVNGNISGLNGPYNNIECPPVDYNWPKQDQYITIQSGRKVLLCKFEYENKAIAYSFYIKTNDSKIPLIQWTINIDSQYSTSTIIEIKNIISSFDLINNYDTFDPDGTLSDISLNPVFKEWLSQKNVSWSAIESSSFSILGIKKEINTIPRCYTEYGYKIISSPDNNKYICFGGGGEPDSYLLLFDKVKNNSLRLAFCGTPCLYDSVFWLDNNKFIFLWTMRDNEYENSMKPYHELHIDLYNLAEDKIYSWVTKHLY
ncbi:MAG: hypothetical protein WAW92_04650 [Minisyncoccia bacterium]